MGHSTSPRMVAHVHMKYVAKYYPERRTSRRWPTSLYQDDPLKQDKYYAYLKHRNQAVYRGETYLLLFEDWCEFWPDAEWIKRGRGGEDLCLTRYDFSSEWSVVNCVVCTRRKHFDIKREQRENSVK